METRPHPDPLTQAPANCPKCGQPLDAKGWCKNCAIRSTLRNTIFIVVGLPLTLSFGGFFFGAAVGSCLAGLSNRQVKMTEITDIYLKIAPPKVAILLGILFGLIYLAVRMIQIRIWSQGSGKP